jgi:hypothetical protein
MTVRIYRVVWQSMCVALAVVGVLTGLAVSPVSVASVVISAAVVGAIVAFALWTVTEPDPGHSVGAFVARAAALTAVTTAAAFGLAVAVGANSFAVALCVLLSCPRLVGRYCSWLESAPKPSTAQFGAAMAAAAWASPGYVPVAASTDLRLLSNEELCQRWRTSCVDLPAQASVISRMGAVEERRCLLDEMERRHPAGFGAWLTSDAPRSATLLAHLTLTPTSRDPVDWDAFPL